MSFLFGDYDPFFDAYRAAPRRDFFRPSFFLNSIIPDEEQEEPEAETKQTNTCDNKDCPCPAGTCTCPKGECKCTKEQCNCPKKDNKKNMNTLTRQRSNKLIHPTSGFGRLDVKENKNNFVVSVDLPGMNKEDIHIATDDDNLTIECERKDEIHEGDETTNYRYVERSFGSFQRTIALPDHVDQDNISAQYENGVLHLTIPKEQIAPKETKKININ
ncbi:hypothetical protein WA158_008303 [Blastocystis sp. Blastoise]